MAGSGGKTIQYSASDRGRPASSRQGSSRSGNAPAERRDQTAGAGIDIQLIAIVAILLFLGLVMLYSTSAYEATIDYGSGTYYLQRQAIFVVLGLVAMVIVTFLPIRFWRSMYGPLYIVSLVLVISLQWFGTTVNGATRWIYFGPVSLQPAEVSKLAVIVLTAAFLTNISREELRTWKGILLVMAPSALQAALIYVISSNLSSALIVLMIAAAMIFVTTRDWKKFIILALIVAALVGVVIYVVSTYGTFDIYQLERIAAWLDPAAYSSDQSMQTLQGLYSIGSGGFFGKGLGKSIQKLGYVPEAQNDMIFAIICEELGLFGAIVIIVLFLYLGWRMAVIAANARTLFESLLVVGVLSHIMIQAILNIAVVTNTLPNTGVTLPFFSYGGSAMLFLLIEVGIVLNVSRNSAS